MSNWTRAHNAWLARECEGWHQIVSGPQRGFWQRPDGVHEVDEPSYLTDPAAAIRAAEAWRKKVPGRTVKLEWREDSVNAGLGDNQAGWHQWYSPCDLPATALAQALYRATGGPA